MADEEEHTGVGVFLIPEASDPIVAASSEPAHLTTVWLGDMGDLDDETIDAIRGEVAAYAGVLDGPVVVPTVERGTLGDDGADVMFLERTEALQALREGLLEASPTVKRVMDSVEQFPEWTPHVTLGYPETPAAGEYDGEAVTFDRVGLWVGPDQEDFPMSGEKGGELAAARQKLSSLVASTTWPEIIDVDSIDNEDLSSYESLFNQPAVTTNASSAVKVNIVDEMPTDELEDDEEYITEIPVHGVATVEGVPTGDGRGFRPGAIKFGPLPQPLGYEFESGHGSDNSRVAIIGRIDEYERRELEDGSAEIRWRGVIMPGKPYGALAIESIVDGSYTGLSVIVDSVTVDVTEEREALRQRILAERSEEKRVDGDTEIPAAVADEDYDVEELLDLMVGDGTQETTWFSDAQVRRFDMVPTGAFQQGYTALGHEFADELTEEALVAAAAALEECGCGGSLRASASGTVIVDLSGLTEEEFEAYDAMTIEEQDAYVEEHDLILASAFRDVPSDERKKLADEGKAMPDGSFPVETVDDLRNAIQAIGRANDPEAVKRFLKKRARELGQEDLIPEDWSLTASAFAPGTHDGPGWITHPIPTARIRRYWVRGKGAAKIRWGVPGDFNRCRAQLAKYVQNPDWLAGMCANMHKEAIGVWPGQEGGGRHAARTAQYDAMVASGLSPAEASGTAWPDPAPLFSLVASAAPIEASYFERRELENPRVGVVVDGDAVYGYIAQWNVCHIGIQNDCTLAPHSPSNYGQYRTGTVMTTNGPVPVGQITMNTGHARGDLSARSTVAHYDNTGTAIADIACGEDRFGIWFAGKIRPNVSDEDRFALAASGRLSGDWRVIGGAYELVAALVVNVPGFSIPDVSITAAADLGPISLVAAGVIRPEDVDVPVEPASTGEALTAETVAGIAIAAAEQVLHAQRRQAIIDSTAPARAALSAHLLNNARARLAKITKE